MNSTDARSMLRRSNPLLVLAVGVLIGVLAAAAGQRPDAASVKASAPVIGDAGAVPSSGAPGTDAAGTGGAASDVSNGGPSASGGATTGSRTQPGAASASGGVADAGGCAGTASSGITGVTNDTINLGVGILDISALKALGPSIDPGNIQEAFDAVLKGMRREGQLPVCGRDIKPFYRTYNVLNPADSRSACAGWADEDHVFAAVTLPGFVAADCVTLEKKKFLINSGGSDAQFQRTPLLYSPYPTEAVYLRSVARWIVQNGIVQGKKIGVYYNKQGPGGSLPPGEQVEKYLIDELARLGHPVDVIVVTDHATTPQGSGDPNTALAVQRFKAAGVEVALPMWGQDDFFQQADAQRYQAQWVQYGVGQVSDAVTSRRPAAFDGALGLVEAHLGEGASGLVPGPAEARCYRMWEAAGGAKIEHRDWAQGQTLRQACSLLDMFTRAAKAAGNDLRNETIARGMYSLRDVPTAYYADQTFAPTKRWGATKTLIERWHADCSCWKVAGPWRALDAS